MQVNTPRRIVLIGSILFVLLCVLFPRWLQIRRNDSYFRWDIGRHFLFFPPRPSAIFPQDAPAIPADEYYVSADWRKEEIRSLVVVAISAGLLFLFRSSKAHGKDVDPNWLTFKRRLLSAMLIACVFPVLAGNGYPLSIQIISMIVSDFKGDISELGPWFPVVMLGVYFLAYTILNLIVLTALNRVIKSRTRKADAVG
jgi:hypothetical protein